MSMTVPSVLRRWLVPAGAALAVVGGGVAIGVVTSAADHSLPPLSAQDLVADLLTTHPDGVQGTVTVRADLGLPSLPIPSAGSADLSSLAAGTHTLRVWYSSPDHARLALLGQQGESDVITDGTQVWVWSSKTNTAVHSTLPSGGLAGLLGQLGLPSLLGSGGLTGGAGPDLGWLGSIGASAMPAPGGVPAPSGMPIPSGLPSIGSLPSGMDPHAIAQMLVTFLSPSTDITTDGNASVAGRAAYELALKPRDKASLIGSVVVDIDAQNYFPLRLAVLPSDGGAPAIEVAFTDVSFARPDASQFTFNPPPGAKVVDGDQAKPDASPGVPDKPAIPVPDATAPDHGPQFSVVGSGWTTVLVGKVPDVDPSAGTLGDVLGLLPKVSGDWGSGRLLSTRLVSVLLTDDGRLLVGAVDPERLYEAAKG